MLTMVTQDASGNGQNRCPKLDHLLLACVVRRLICMISRAALLVPWAVRAVQAEMAAGPAQYLGPYWFCTAGMCC